MRRNVQSVQFLRFFAAALVTFHHSSEFLAEKFPGVMPRPVLYLTGFGASGVHIFFVISGFVMVFTSLSGEHLKPSVFLAKRFIRIFPIYWICAALYILYGDTIDARNVYQAQRLIGSLLLLPSDASLIIGQAWSLSYELYFYVCFAAILKLRPRIGLILLTSVFLLCIAFRSTLSLSNPLVALATSPLLIEFLAGAWIGYIAISGCKIDPVTSVVLIILGVIGFIIGIVLGYDRVPFFITWGLPSALLVGGFVFAEIGGMSIKSVAAISFLGDSSYSLYLIHPLFIQFLLLFLLNQKIIPTQLASALSLCAILTALCIVAAIALYNSVERNLVLHLQKMILSRIRDRKSERGQ